MNPIDGPIKPVRQDTSLGGLSIGQFFLQLTFRYYNDALKQVAYLFNKVIRCIQGLSVMFVQVYAYSFIGKRIMNT